MRLILNPAFAKVIWLLLVIWSTHPVSACNHRGTRERVAGLQSNITTFLASLKANASARLAANKENVVRRMAQSQVTSLALASGTASTFAANSDPVSISAGNGMATVGGSGSLGGASNALNASLTVAGGDTSNSSNGAGVMTMLRSRINNALNGSRVSVSNKAAGNQPQTNARPDLSPAAARVEERPGGLDRESLPLFMEDKIRSTNPLSPPTFQGMHRDSVSPANNSTASTAASDVAVAVAPKESLRSSLALPTDNLPGGIPLGSPSGDIATELKNNLADVEFLLQSYRIDTEEALMNQHLLTATATLDTFYVQLEAAILGLDREERRQVEGNYSAILERFQTDTKQITELAQADNADIGKRFRDYTDKVVAAISGNSSLATSLKREGARILQAHNAAIAELLQKFQLGTLALQGNRRKTSIKRF